MKKIAYITFTTFLIFVSGLFFLGWKGEPSYNRYIPEAHFLFSTDPSANKLFRETVEDIPIGTQFWIRVEVQIKCGIISNIVHSNNARKIPVAITIPNTEILDFSVMDAPSNMNPIEDAVKGTRTYTFYAYASTDPKKVYVVFRCRALKSGTQKISLEYGDAVNKDHNQFRVVTYVEE